MPFFLIFLVLASVLELSVFDFFGDVFVLLEPVFGVAKMSRKLCGLSIGDVLFSWASFLA